MRFFASVRIPHTPLRVGMISSPVRCAHCGRFNWPAFWFGVGIGVVGLVALVLFWHP